MNRANKDNCEWNKRGYCLIKECLSDCDLGTLEYDKIKVINRMNKEVGIMQRYYITGIFKRKDEVIKDKLMGMMVLLRILKQEFGYDIKKYLDTLKVSPILRTKIILFIDRDRKKRLV